MTRSSKIKFGNWLAVSIALISIRALMPQMVLAEAPKIMKGEVEFSYKDDKAKTVYLAGDFNSWADNDNGKVSKPEYLMQKVSNGFWRKKVKMGGGKHQYKFVVDGNWVADPFVKDMDKDGNSILTVEGSAVPAESAKSGGGKGPKMVDGGYEFSFRAPQAKSVHIAGDFNSWAENNNGQVSRPEYLMKKGPDGVWTKIVMLSPGQHTYKFVIDGSNWVADPNNSAPRDKDDNSTLVAEAAKGGMKGSAASGSASGPKKVAGGYEFSFKAPQARSVHLAGDFNNWAENNSGQVSRPEYLMQKGSDGIWRKTVKLSPGQHTYKFVIDGSNWSPDPNNSAPHDKDDNSTFMAQ